MLTIVLAFLALVILSLCLLLCVQSPMLNRFVRQNMGEFRTDCLLLFSKKALEASIAQWKSRVDVYSELKVKDDSARRYRRNWKWRCGWGGRQQRRCAAGAPAAGTAGAARIDYLSSDRLRIIDAKFSTLLQLQTLLGVMLTITTNKFWEHLRVRSPATGEVD